jgi:hypothetical protein
MLRPCQERPTTPRLSPRGPAAASAWSPVTAVSWADTLPRTGSLARLMAGAKRPPLGRWGRGTTLAWDGRSRRRWSGARSCSASTWPASAKPRPRSSRTSVPMAAGSGVSCSLSDNSGPRPTADGGAATSTVDGSQPPTHRPQRAGERARSIHQDRLLISNLQVSAMQTAVFPGDPRTSRAK